MEVIRKEFCDKYKIPWVQQKWLKDAKTLWICVCNYQDWTFVEKLLDLFPDLLEPELYDLSWGIFNGVIMSNTHLLRIVISQFSKSPNIHHKQRALQLLLHFYLHTDHHSVRHLNRFYQSCQVSVDGLLDNLQDLGPLYQNIYLQLFALDDVKPCISRIFDISKSNHNMRQSFNRFIFMCMIFNRCDVIENIYQTMKTIDICPPIHTISYMRHFACVIQRRWRSYMNLRAKRAIAQVCYKLDLRDNIAYVIYKHSGLENSYKKI